MNGKCAQLHDESVIDCPIIFREMKSLLRFHEKHRQFCKTLLRYIISRCGNSRNLLSQFFTKKLREINVIVIKLYTYVRTLTSPSRFHKIS